MEKAKKETIDTQAQADEPKKQVYTYEWPVGEATPQIGEVKKKTDPTKEEEEEV
jgi:hypothetical protein